MLNPTTTRWRLRNLKCGNLHHAVETVSGFQVI